MVMSPRAACNLLSGFNSEIEFHLVSAVITWVPKVCFGTHVLFIYSLLSILMCNLNHAQ